MLIKALLVRNTVIHNTKQFIFSFYYLFQFKSINNKLNNIVKRFYAWYIPLHILQHILLMYHLKYKVGSNVLVYKWVIPIQHNIISIINENNSTHMQYRGNNYLMQLLHVIQKLFRKLLSATMTYIIIIVMSDNE